MHLCWANNLQPKEFLLNFLTKESLQSLSLQSGGFASLSQKRKTSGEGAGAEEKEHDESLR